MVGGGYLRHYVFSTAKLISKTGLADGESRYLGKEDQDLSTIPPSHSMLTPGRAVLALYPIVRRLTGNCYLPILKSLV